jgi:DNA transformation protein and related proteins
MRIEDAKNIGPELAADLRTIGVDTLEQLQDAGPADVWQQLYDAGLRDCTHSRLALEGAAREVRWFSIDPDTRRAIAAEIEHRT